MPDLSAIASLVRLPAALSAPGDPLLGAAASGAQRTPLRAVGLVGASCSLYLAGMALNDYADRDVDAVERPGRPIPSGRVSARFALGLGTALTVAGVGLAGLSGGRRALAVAAPLAANVWAYDLVLKGTPAGSVAMASARFLDVLLGADPARRRQALPAAAIVGAHTLKLTMVSRHEVGGAGPEVGWTALAATAAVTAVGGMWAAQRLAVSAVHGGRSRRVADALATAGLLGTYAVTSGRTELAAARDPSPAALQRSVGVGVLGLMPLEAGLHAAAVGPLPVTAGIAGVWPLARRFARRRSVT